MLLADSVGNSSVHKSSLHNSGILWTDPCTRLCSRVQQPADGDLCALPGFKGDIVDETQSVAQQMQRKGHVVKCQKNCFHEGWNFNNVEPGLGLRPQSLKTLSLARYFSPATHAVWPRVAVSLVHWPLQSGLHQSQRVQLIHNIVKMSLWKELVSFQRKAEIWERQSFTSISRHEMLWARPPLE